MYYYFLAGSDLLSLFNVANVAGMAKEHNKRAIARLSLQAHFGHGNFETTGNK